MQIRSQTTRRNVLEAARDQFSKLGYEAASVDAICAQAEISKGAFYHHFPSKQAVFLALLEEWLAGLENGFRLLRESSKDAGQALLGMIDILPSVLREAEGRLPMYIEFWMQANRDPKLREATIAPYHRFRTYIADMVRDGIRAGTFREMDAESAALALVSLAIGLLLQGIAEPAGEEWPMANRKILSLLLDTMRRNPQ
jgi:AcrR family transcriptional regulator